jgi:hypothetical protein
MPDPDSLPERELPLFEGEVRLGAMPSAPMDELQSGDEISLVELPFPSWPGKTDWISPILDWGILGNDRLGDCTEACIGHIIESWTDVLGPRANVTEGDVIRAYSQITGYVPGNPSTDRGTRSDNAMEWWRSIGIGAHRIDAYARSNAVNLLALHKPMIMQLVHFYGAAFVVIEVPSPAIAWFRMGQPWSNLMGESIGLHCVPILAYDDVYCEIITWGRPHKVTWAFLSDYMRELWGVVSSDWIGTNGLSVHGHSLDYLLQRLRRVVVFSTG